MTFQFLNDLFQQITTCENFIKQDLEFRELFNEKILTITSETKRHTLLIDSGLNSLKENQNILLESVIMMKGSE